MNFPVFDLHCDTALRMAKDPEMFLMKNTGHIDLERAKTLPGYVQCFACYTSTWDKLPAGVKTIEDVFEKELSVVIRELNAYPDVIRQAYTAADIEENQKNGLMSGLLTLEGTAGFGFDPALLEDLYRIGFRITTLGWNEKNPLTGSHVTGGGLTDAGREFVKEAQRLGMIVDGSHISDEGFWDIMEITQAPIIASHSNILSICDSSRNLTDDMFRAICQTGGVAGFNQYAAFVGEEPTMDKACEHILHFLSMDPNGDHIALGGDLDGCDALTQGFEGVQSYPDFAKALLSRGVNENILMNMYWNNALGVIRTCCM